MSGIEHANLNVDGVRIHAVSRGSGPLVILIHGFPESWYSWRHQIEALAAAGYRALAIDQRGYGRSSKLPRREDYGILRLAADVAGVAAACTQRPPVIVGHDWGAPVAWTAAWLYPERFCGVVGISVPFAARGVIGLPGNPFGERRPAEYHRELAGPDRLFYQEYFAAQEGIVAEIEEDLRGWICGLVYSVCGDALARSGQHGPADPVIAIREGPLCIAPGARMRDGFTRPRRLPSWFSEADLDFYAEEFERSGFGGPLSYYSNLDADWQALEPWSQRPLDVPAFFIGGSLDVGTIWGREALARAPERMTRFYGSSVLEGCGHWIQQERPDETSRLLIDFLREIRYVP